MVTVEHIIGNPLLEVEPCSGQRGRVATKSGQNVFETEKIRSALQYLEN